MNTRNIPLPMRAARASFGSSSRREILNQSTSIGEDILTGSNPASLRTFEKRPSAPAVPPPVAHAPHHPVLLEELLHPGPHGESEVRVALRLLSNELQETRLGHHHYVGEPCPQSREEVEGELPTFGRHGKVPDLRVAELEEAIG